MGIEGAVLMGIEGALLTGTEGAVLMVIKKAGGFG